MFSKTCEYAIKATIYIAHQNEEQPCVGVKEIAKNINAPEHFIAKILQVLSRNKIINSIKGPNGGFCMTEKQAQKPIIDIVNIIDGDGIKTNCILGLEACNHENPCPMHEEYQAIKKGILAMLEKNTIQDFNNKVLTNKAVLIS